MRRDRFFPKQVYLWGSILEKKRLDTLVGALCCVGRGFGRAGRAGPGWAQIWLCLARSAGLGVLGALGWVGRRVWLWWARWAGLIWPCWACWAGLGVGFGFGRRANFARVGRRFGFAWRAQLGVGFGRAGRVGLGWGVGFGSGLRWAWDLAVLGALGWGLALVGAVGWVGCGWLSVYGLHCTCLLHVFMMSLCLSSCVSQMVSWGLSKTKPGIPEWNVVLSNSVFEQCEANEMEAKGEKRQ